MALVLVEGENEIPGLLNREYASTTFKNLDTTNASGTLRNFKPINFEGTAARSSRVEKDVFYILPVACLTGFATAYIAWS